MVRASPDPRKAAAAALARDTDLTLTAIAARTGLAKTTVASWSGLHGWRPQILRPGRWSPARKAALARVHATPGVDPGDLAAALGAAPEAAAALFRACGFGSRRREPGRDGASLRATLRGHIARQIARFDAALHDAPAADLDAAKFDSSKFDKSKFDTAKFDTAKILRDLGGLKKLLDEVDDAIGGGRDGADRGGLPRLGEPLADDTLARLDLPALRAEVARRYAAFAGERPDAGLPGEPAAAADPGARR